MNTKKGILVLLLIFTVYCWETDFENDSYFHYEGSINNKYEISMDLKFNGDQIRGTYYYKKHGSLLKVLGTLKETNEVVLESYDDDGYLMETFNGSFDDNFNYSGKWVSGDKEFPFSLEQNYENSLSAEFVTSTSEHYLFENNDNPHAMAEQILIELDMPGNNAEVVSNIKQVIYEDYIDAVGQGLNVRTIELVNNEGFIGDYVALEDGITQSEIEEARNTYEYELYENHEIGYNDDNILVIEKYYFEYTGGAHENAFIQFFVFDLENGNQIKLDDIFIDNYQPKLKKLLNDKLGYLYQDYDGDLTKFDYFEEEIDITENFFINRAGITFTYNTYEIAPYSMGETIISIPYKDLTELISDDSVIKRF